MALHPRSVVLPVLAAAASVAVVAGLVPAYLTGERAAAPPRVAPARQATIAMPVPAVCLSAALCANAFYQSEASAYSGRALAGFVRREWHEAMARVGRAKGPKSVERTSAGVAADSGPVLARLD